MKNYNTVYALGALVVIAGAIMNFLHITGSYYVTIFGLIAMTLYQSWHIKKLNTKINDLENQGSKKQRE